MWRLVEDSADVYAGWGRIQDFGWTIDYCKSMAKTICILTWLGADDQDLRQLADLSLSGDRSNSSVVSFSLPLGSCLPED